MTLVAGRFSLVDHDGRAVGHQDYAGRFMLVAFGFTHCRVVCPRNLAKLDAALDGLGPDAAQIAGLYITVDPARDSAAVLRRYLLAHPRFTGLTGSAEQLAAARSAFRVFARRRPDAEDPDGYAMPHTAISYLLGPDGTLRDHFPELLTADEVRVRIAAVLDAAGRGGDAG
ncbi:SCO family protein [Zavarzinia sp. CC-PAN008]|uniref:SCO family protein n=1 Tax=Zavarzinia sp. CC-PAN008 TaxID=3243332 RepID=UPI003F7482F7